MKNRLWITALLVMIPQVTLAAPAELNVVNSLKLAAEGAGATLRIEGTKSPTFTVFRLSDPARVVIDLAGADVSAVRGSREGLGPVAGVAVSQFSDEQATVGRVMINVADEARYDVRAVGKDVVVSVAGSVPAPAPTVSAEAAPAVEAPVVETAVAEVVSAPVAAGPKARATGEEDVVRTRVDEKSVANPGHKLSSLNFGKKGGAFTVELAADGDVGTYELVELTNPPRLALDLLGFDKTLRARKPGSGSPLHEVRFGKHEGKVRVVLEAKGDELPEYRVERVRNGLRVALGGSATQVTSAPAKTVAAAAAPALEAKPVARPAAKLANVRDVAFKGDESKGRVLIGVPRSTEYRVSRPDPRTAVLTLSGASLPKRLERSLDTSAFGGPVKMVSSFTAPGENDSVQVVATLDGAAQDKVSFDSKGQLCWEFTSDEPVKSASAEVLIDGRRVDLEESAAVAPRAGGFSSEAPNYAASSSTRKPRYTGRRVSFEFKDIEIHNLLRIIAEVSKKNIIVADNVSGKVTIRLRNVPWDQALDLILKSKGLDKDEMGSILRIAPMKELEEERKIAAERKKMAEGFEPLKVRLIPVNYATAAEISTKVKDLLSERGSMSVDTRTNVIIVKDTLEALARAEGLVRRLDTQTPQVLIESRIVEANSSFSREFGIQWGGNISLSPTTGNPTGLLFPNIVRIAGASEAGTTLGTADVPNFAVNMPAPIGAGAGGGVGFIFGSAGGAVALNLRLSAMESSGQVKTISAPKITTLDNQAATIGQGISIPFSQVSAAGVNTSFVEAKLELQVTPHVTADGSVLLNIAATNNQPDPSFSGANGQPAISKKEAKTQVLVKDGDTTVIGGIYTRSQSVNASAVPVLSKVPVLGWLFKKNREVDNRTELLIFITPRIVNRNQVVAAGEPSIP